ncbi:MAG: hypothetical protein KGK00_02150 [Paracoccaceae bacterium]|nr:hypothetical protein [Paracoccaceae bacterium]
MRLIPLTTAALVLALAQASTAAPQVNSEEAKARDALLASLSSLKEDNLYLAELAAYQAQLIVSAKADPIAVRDTGRRPMDACLATRLKTICPLFQNTFSTAN